MSESKPNPKDLDWVTLNSNADEYVIETFMEKGLRKCKENPFVPIGTAATVLALSIGIRSFFKGNKILSQRMMRARIIAQGATFVAIIGGMVSMAEKKK